MVNLVKLEVYSFFSHQIFLWWGFLVPASWELSSYVLAAIWRGFHISNALNLDQIYILASNTLVILALRKYKQRSPWGAFIMGVHSVTTTIQCKFINISNPQSSRIVKFLLRFLSRLASCNKVWYPTSSDRNDVDVPQSFDFSWVINAHFP